MIVIYRGFGMLAPAFGILAALLMNVVSFRLLGVSFYEDNKWPKLCALILAGIACLMVGVLLKRKRNRDACLQEQQVELQSAEHEMQNRRSSSNSFDHLMFIPLQYWSIIYFVAAIIYGGLSTSGAAKSRTYNEPPRAQATPVREHTALTTENLDDYRKLLFADLTLEEFVTLHNLPNDPFAKAYQYLKAGETGGTKRCLKEILSNPEAEVRDKLLAWRALRALGEKPPPSVASQVHGVVMEVPIDNSIDTLVAYSDGTSRYVSGSGAGVIIWDSTDDSQVTKLAKNLIKSAEPLVEKAAIYDKHLPAKDNVIRLSILTYGGIRVREGKVDFESVHMVSPGHVLMPACDIGTELFLKLIEASKTQKP